jgi:hypothetical protein
MQALKRKQQLQQLLALVVRGCITPAPTDTSTTVSAWYEARLGEACDEAQGRSWQVTERYQCCWNRHAFKQYRNKLERQLLSKMIACFSLRPVQTLVACLIVQSLTVQQ